MIRFHHFSVGLNEEQRVHACVQGNREEALARLRRDDGIWRRLSVYFHGTYEFNPRVHRCRPSRRLTFWMGKQEDHLRMLADAEERRQTSERAEADEEAAHVKSIAALLDRAKDAA